MQRYEYGVRSHRHRREMEVVKEHWQVTVETPGGREREVECSRRDALDRRRVLVSAEAVFCVPQLEKELELGTVQGLFNLEMKRNL